MTSTSAPHCRIHSRISIVPETVARQRREPSASVSSVWVGCQRRLADAARDARRETEDDLDLGLVGDDVPRRPERRGRGRRVGRLERARGQRDGPDPLDLERPDRAALLVEADQVERVGLERRFEQVRTDRRSPRGRARLVVGRRVVDGHDPPFGPGLGQEPDVGAEALVARRLGQTVEGPFDVLRQRRRQASLELLERGRQVRVVLVRVADHQPRREHDGHRLALGQLERRQEGLLVIDPPDALVAPDREPQLVLERGQVAIDGPHGHPDAGRDVGGAHALGVRLQDRDEARQTCQPVALGRVSAAVVIEGHGVGG